MKNKKVHAILGPRNSEQARYIVRLGEVEFQKPVIWFPMTGPSLLPPPSPSSIYTGQGLNCYQFQAIAAIIKALGWQSIVPIYEETEYGSHLVPCLTNVLKEMGIQMANVTAIDSSSRDINSILDTLTNMRTHVFLVHMSMDLGTSFILSAQKKEMIGEGYAWILTQELSSLTDPQVPLVRNLYNGSPVPVDNFTDFVSLKRYMQGALGVRPMDSNKTDLRRAKEKNFTDRFLGTLPIYGWWAYHTIEALAMAVEKVEKAGTDNGLTLGDEIRATTFTGVSGVKFNLSQGQLDQSEYEVYNVISARERIIGFWSPKNGLVQDHIEGGGGGEASGGREYQLKDPLWSGDTLAKPPKLRIGVPRTNYFPEFVHVYNSSNSSKLQVDGFAYNVFLKALDVLPFPLNNYEFVPLPNKSRSDNTTYDDMLCTQMKQEDLDAIIGDITVVASRTNCVDFTLPYLDSSVAMVVRMKNASTSGILLKPFGGLLWLTLGLIFVAATIIILLLEKYKTKSNEIKKMDQFLINPFLVYKIDVMEKFASSAAGWMVILTSFLFILVVQVYTANLTSILTQGKEREPTFKDEYVINKSSNLHVGYRNGSWVRELLTEQLGFCSSRLIALNSPEEYNERLSRGTKKGGVDAIFDETPYLTLFLSEYKSGFMMTGPIYKTGGFAFAFPRKSSLGLHFSNAILKVTQDAEPYSVLMARSSLPTSIEDLEFEDESDIETSKLEIDIFGGLYPVLLSVVALFLCLSIPILIEWWRKK
ncbi:hypothetical protein QN277_025186 [Acacia crassicarpa]|uniref:Ionotropic glutamate receptor C-terminal domain-containing protein n=1 Tax=Acacia crassicarpa TaxID=499986 RepID=A0AAE1ML40_9FABA|nr:hypothetical protein QN277_025186 [Acacia crassicarpa]